MRLTVCRESRQHPYLLVAKTSFLVFRLHGWFIHTFAFLICIHSEHGTASYWAVDTNWTSSCLLVLTIPHRKD